MWRVFTSYIIYQIYQHTYTIYQIYQHTYTIYQIYQHTYTIYQESHDHFYNSQPWFSISTGSSVSPWININGSNTETLNTCQYKIAEGICVFSMLPVCSVIENNRYNHTTLTFQNMHQPPCFSELVLSSLFSTCISRTTTFQKYIMSCKQHIAKYLYLFLKYYSDDCTSTITRALSETESI